MPSSLRRTSARIILGSHDCLMDSGCRTQQLVGFSCGLRLPVSPRDRSRGRCSNASAVRFYFSGRHVVRAHRHLASSPWHRLASRLSRVFDRLLRILLRSRPYLVRLLTDSSAFMTHTQSTESPNPWESSECVRFLSLVTWWVVGNDPPRGGGSGEPWFPHRPESTGQRRVGGRNSLRHASAEAAAHETSGGRPTGEPFAGMDRRLSASPLV